MSGSAAALHPDDVALSCGGLIASLRELGQNVTILTVYSGDGSAGGLTPFQREMADAVRSYGRAIAEFGRVDGSAERYWVSGRV